MTPKSVAYCLLPILAVALIAVVVLWVTATGDNVKSEIRIEIVKSLLQLSLVAIIGGGIGALYKSIDAGMTRRQKALEQARHESQLRAEIRIGFLSRLGSIYRDVKGARRRLRAGGLTTKWGHAPDVMSANHAQLYCEQMAFINDAQLQLEGLAIEVDSLPAFMQLRSVGGNLRKMEDYLRQILGEYEETRPKLDAGDPVRFVELERLDEFTGTADREFEYSRYRSKNNYRLNHNFSSPSEKVVREISEHLA